MFNAIEITAAAIETAIAEGKSVFANGALLHLPAEAYQSLLDGGLLAEIDAGENGTCYGVESDADIEAGNGMVYCFIAA